MKTDVAFIGKKLQVLHVLQIQAILNIEDHMVTKMKNSNN